MSESGRNATLSIARSGTPVRRRFERSGPARSEGVRAPRPVAAGPLRSTDPLPERTSGAAPTPGPPARHGFTRTLSIVASMAANPGSAQFGANVPTRTDLKGSAGATPSSSA